MPLTVQVKPSSVVCFGKMPTHGDFVRYNAHGSLARAVDEWLQHGLYFSKNHGTSRSDGAGESAPIHFVFNPPHEASALAGVIQQSRDRVGRQYPFLVAAEIERNQAEARVAGQLPLNLAGFLDWATELACEAASGRVDYRDLGSHLEQMPAPSRSSADGLAGGEAYLRQTTLKQFCERLWDAFEDTRKYRLFKNLLDIVQPVQQNLPASFPLGLKFPLCSNCASPSGNVSFWLDVCWHLLKQPFATPSFFWVPEKAESSGDRPYLLVFFRQPAPSTLAYLFARVKDHEHVCDLEQMGTESATDIVLSIPVRYGRLLEYEDISLRDFLNGL